MMWLCVESPGNGFTEGNIYKTGNGSGLIDDDGYWRVSARIYNYNRIYFIELSLEDYINQL